MNVRIGKRGDIVSHLLFDCFVLYFGREIPQQRVALRSFTLDHGLHRIQQLGVMKRAVGMY
jgi:hypothetical protein